mgnify:CR=1 FL=1
MVATVQVFTDFGGAVNAPGTKQNINAVGPPNARFKDADNNTIDTLNPIPIPSSGTRFSRWKHFYIEVTVAPDTQIDNLKIFTDGTGFGTGITVEVAQETPANTAAGDAGYDVADVANEDMTNHADVILTPQDFFTKTCGAPKTVTISEAGSILDAIGEESDYVILQMEVLSTATPGDLTDETITNEYDEI